MYSFIAFFLAVGTWFGIAAFQSGFARISGRPARYVWFIFPMVWLAFAVIGVVFQLSVSALIDLWKISATIFFLGLVFWGYSFFRNKFWKKVFIGVFVTVGALIVVGIMFTSYSYYLDIRNTERVEVSGLNVRGEKIMMYGRLSKESTYDANYNFLQKFIPAGVDWRSIVIRDTSCDLLSFKIDKDDIVTCSSCLSEHLYKQASELCPLSSDELRKFWALKKWILIKN